MSLVNLASQYYRTTISIFLFVIVSGSLVFNNIPKESSPDVSLPYIYVSLGLTGISPEDSEKLLIKPVEDEVSNIEGKKEMTSTSYQGGGNVLLEFDAGFDPDQALLDTREQVDRAKSDLPDDADEPKVSEVNISLFPILVVSISGDISEFLLKKISNDLKDKWELILSKLELPSTRMLLSQQAELESFDSEKITIALSPNWESMITVSYTHLTLPTISDV